MTNFFAHSDPDDRPLGDPLARWQPLSEHLRNVAALAEEFAREAGATEAQIRRARALGLLHDVGKYRREFQRLIRGEVKKAPHSIYGAAVARHGGAPDVAFAIAGHHAGMPDPAPLKEALVKVQGEIAGLLMTAKRDCPEIDICLQSDLGPIKGDIDCATRVLFSCLIDADRIDTARHGGMEVPEAAALNAGQRLENLLRVTAGKAALVEEGPVKAARAVVLHACLEAAERQGSLYSLTVPTGGAKTLAAMAFALRRAEVFPDTVRRVIVVIPYLSIIEQNAKVYREALGSDAVLEHHSGIWRTDDESEERYLNPAHKLAIENWNAPVVVTTSVRFFESLFSNKPKDLRRMHNLAHSVVILDEVQTLPRGRVAPILSMIRDMAAGWGTTFVFSTATQPAFEKHGAVKDDPRWDKGTLDEIMPEPKELFGALRRVEVQWPERGSRKTWDEVAKGVSGERQALVVVNTRMHALTLYRKLAAGRRGVLHLSNNMCPVHRLERLDEIRRRLKADEDCLVVATQLVEAGVDLDFPAVWRAMGPLDSIIQAAGRCDREGRLTKELGKPGGRVVVFQPEENQMPPGEYEEAAKITEALAAAGEPAIDDPEFIRAYFDRYYDTNALDSDQIQDLRRNLKFRSVAESFSMIEDNSWSVIVPFDESAVEMLKRLRFGALSVVRDLQRYTINLWKNDFAKGKLSGAIYQVVEGKDIWAVREGFYDTETGLRLEPGAENYVI